MVLMGQGMGLLTDSLRGRKKTGVKGGGDQKKGSEDPFDVALAFATLCLCPCEAQCKKLSARSSMQETQRMQLFK